MQSVDGCFHLMASTSLVLNRELFFVYQCFVRKNGCLLGRGRDGVLYRFLNLCLGN